MVRYTVTMSLPSGSSVAMPYLPMVNGHATKRPNGGKEHHHVQAPEYVLRSPFQEVNDGLAARVLAERDAQHNGHQQHLQGEVIGQEVAPREFARPLGETRPPCRC
jgi:hypothetical protein